MNNREWLYSLDVADLADWFDAEHVDANDVSTRKGDVRADGVCANDVDASQDSREKLDEEAHERIANLTDDLETAHAKNRVLRAHIRKMQNGRNGWHIKAEKLQKQIDELTAERDALADDLFTCNKEREQYRKLFSKSLTLADEIVNLQP